MTAPAKLRIKNKAEVDRELGLAIARLRDTRIGIFREVVWEVFKHVTAQSPQFSGAMVAHFFIGVDKDESYYNPAWGRQDLKLHRSMSGDIRPLERGNRYWMEFARKREEPKLARIRRNSVVYITNGVRGDTDGGNSSSSYADDLQDAAYWMTKLRDANKPYIVTQESALMVATKYWGTKRDPFTWAPASATRE